MPAARAIDALTSALISARVSSAYAYSVRAFWHRRPTDRTCANSVGEKVSVGGRRTGRPGKGEM
jgi:hypothetical protein